MGGGTGKFDEVRTREDPVLNRTDPGDRLSTPLHHVDGAVLSHSCQNLAEVLRGFGGAHYTQSIG